MDKEDKTQRYGCPLVSFEDSKGDMKEDMGRASNPLGRPSAQGRTSTSAMKALEVRKSMSREVQSNRHWYFGMAAMMNPVSLQGRDLEPILSKPAELLDMELAFELAGAGLAGGLVVARPKKGATFHGVLHLFTDEDIEALDNIEIAMGRKDSARISATARAYTGELVPVTVYALKPEDVNQENQKPDQRYVDIMIEGARHFGVASSYIQYLRTIETLPRPDPSSLAGFPIPASVIPGANPMVPNDGKDGNPMQISLNGKVLEWVGPKDSEIFHFLMDTAAGTDITLSGAKMKYDPKYGMPDRYEDMTEEHCRFVEDHFCKMPFAAHMKVVGTSYKPDPSTRVDWKSIALLDTIAPRCILRSDALGGEFIDDSLVLGYDDMEILSDRRKATYFYRPLPEGNIKTQSKKFSFRSIGN
mmetsp:Transcript_25248/g.30569  ORF Transcript_25248/g.30569 Transcript_25248/m.30569 type:complete len:416 (+) Transcript_25248:390-1637(+)|eukprot:CAMPEP_0197846466 /NCGR_PEP_ID=MMETSP1438-20131217/3201_1 /TAXON_ID=1461541 /ORGANISM="Pterosperma sp., Strain CCMP1384" /LENGTH=415 /DNA_ID=CAMNT_0043458129 /DNA_START=389 /DNA_END=1636 /DNA_ORIENTATION=+